MMFFRFYFRNGVGDKANLTIGGECTPKSALNIALNQLREKEGFMEEEVILYDGEVRYGGGRWLPFNVVRLLLKRLQYDFEKNKVKIIHTSASKVNKDE